MVFQKHGHQTAPPSPSATIPEPTSTLSRLVPSVRSPGQPLPAVRSGHRTALPFSSAMAGGMAAGGGGRPADFDHAAAAGDPPRRHPPGHLSVAAPNPGALAL